MEASAGEHARPPPLRGAWPFTGRVRELAEATAAVSSSDTAGIAIVGGPGTGKSRLAEEAARTAERNGLHVARVSATRSAGAIPLGAMAHLLPRGLELQAPDGDVPDPVRLLGEARRVLSAGAAPIVLFVDDGHLLDAVSLTLLVALVDEHQASVIITVRTGEDLPDALAGLWRSDKVARLDLTPLDDHEMESLLAAGLGGPVAGRTVRVLCDASEGNPLMLRELVRAALSEDVLIEVHGVWTLVGALPTQHRAAELLDQLVGAFAGDEREVLGLLAAVGPTSVDLLVARFGSDALEVLEGQGLVTIGIGANPVDLEVASLANPLLGASLRAATPTLRARSILRKHAEQIEARTPRHPGDELRAASWRLEAGDEIDPGLAEASATLARHAEDFDLTLRLARVAHTGRPTIRTAILLGEALYETGSWHQAESVLAEASVLDGTPAEIVRLTGQRGTNLLFGLLDPDRARGVTEAATEQIPESETALLDELTCRRALVQLYDGRPSAALETLDGMPDAARLGALRDPSAGSLGADEARAQILWATPGIPALALNGRTTEAIELAQLAYQLHSTLPGDIALTSPETHLLTLCVALQEHGALQEAQDLAITGFEASVAAGVLTGQTWFALSLARTSLIRAQPAIGRRWCDEAATLTESSGWRGPRMMALTGSAAMSALAGDVARAERALTESASIVGRFGFLLPERCLGPAWTLAARGRRKQALELLVDGADLARTTGHWTVEAWLLYEAARVGEPADVVVRLEELAQLCDGPLVAARAGHVRAKVAGSAPGLLGAADSFEAMGCFLVAAEACRQAADRLRSAGDQRGANAATLRSSHLALQADGGISDDLLDPAVAVPLTEREREIAVLAAAGVSSQEIADRLYLSIRTVGNHLGKVYSKLGVSGKTELAASLGREAGR